MNLSIERTRSYAYSQAKQVLKLSIDQLQSPYVASFLAIVYKEAQDLEVIEKLRQWLYEYISIFIFSDPREQTDLREKTLAIAAYIYIENADNNLYQLPSEFISKYIDYASKQDWYDDTLLAFVCGLSSAKYTACDFGVNYLQDRLPLFHTQNNIAAICQAMYLHKAIQNNQIVVSSLNLVKKNIASSSLQIYECAWSLLALSRLSSEEDLKLLSTLKKQLEQEIETITDPLLIQAFSVTREQGTSHFWGPRNTTNAGTLQNTAISNDSDEFTEIFESSSAANLDWGELSLIAACLCLSNCSYSLCLAGYSEDKINKILIDERIANNGGVVISKEANFVGNLLSLLITFIFGLAGFVYLFGIEMKSGSIQTTSRPGLGDLLFLAIWGDYLLSQIQSIFRGQSALEGMVKIPLLRHIGSLLNKKEV